MLCKISYTDSLNAATTEVEKAEVSKLQADLDAAQVLVSELPAGAEKTALQTRIDAVQDIIDLNAALAAAKARAAALAEADYTPESWATLTTALALAETTDGEKTAKTAAICSAITLDRKVSLPAGAKIVVTDSSPANWKAIADYTCTGGELPSALRTAILNGNAVFAFAPGEYNIQGSARHISVGSNTTLMGINTINQPEDIKTVIYPDSSTMAVFTTKTALLSTQECNADQFGQIIVNGTTGVTIQDIVLNGYSILRLNNAKDTTVKRVLIHNYRGTYPNGTWCNMGYGRATEASGSRHLPEYPY